MSIGKTSRRKPGRPRKYGRGRVNATVRFTPERYAELRAQADQQGRSLSEQVEHIIENAVRDRELIADLRRKADANFEEGLKDVRIVTTHAVEQADKLRAAHADEIDRAAAYAIEEKRLAEIVEAAVTRALGKTYRPIGERK
jgi:hypothetical protein